MEKKMKITEMNGKIIKHINNTDVALFVSTVEARDDGNFDVQGLWINISSPGVWWMMKSDDVTIMKHQVCNWKEFSIHDRKQRKQRKHIGNKVVYV